jgi:hypothetical protein
VASESVIKAWLKNSAKRIFILRRLARWHFSKWRYFDYSPLVKENGGRQSLRRVGFRSKTRILVPTCVGSQIGSTHLEGAIAAALSLRGASVEFLLCDEVLPACMACEIGFLGDEKRIDARSLSRLFCKACYKPAAAAYQTLGLRVRRLSEGLSTEDIAQCNRDAAALPIENIRSFTTDGIRVGEQAYAGALRFFARGSLEASRTSEIVLRQYLAASLITVRAFARLIEAQRYECAVFNHGIYVPQGIIGDVCRNRGVRVVNWNAAYRKNCFIFSHHDTYHHTMISEPIPNWESMVWNERREQSLMKYLNSRRNGANDWIWFHEKPLHQVESSLVGLGIDPSKPCIGLLTSVMWDAVLHYASNAFSNMLDWIFATIDYFKSRTDIQLIIRIHPAEIQGGLPSRQRVYEEICKRYPEGVPGNVFVIPPESKLSTYSLMEHCNAAVIYSTKTGIELAAIGIPVIVAGEAWIRNKGFSMDVSSPEEYVRTLDKLPLTRRMPELSVRRAKKYAYHFFFRRMIPLEFFEPTGGNPPFRIKLYSMDELKPGASRGLDLICDGILKGSDFIYDDLIAAEQPVSS